jgi:hypothetical protein
MLIIGLAVTLLGFIISLFSLTMTTAAGARMGIVLAGIAVSLIGIIGIVNKAFMKTANWNKR